MKGEHYFVDGLLMSDNTTYYMIKLATPKIDPIIFRAFERVSCYDIVSFNLVVYFLLIAFIDGECVDTSKFCRNNCLSYNYLEITLFIFLGFINSFNLFFIGV